MTNMEDEFIFGDANEKPNMRQLLQLEMEQAAINTYIRQEKKKEKEKEKKEERVVGMYAALIARRK